MPGTDVPSVVLLSEQVVSTPDTLSSGVDVQSSSSSSGMVHWNEQTTVFTAQNLNSHTYRGHSEWKTLQRQPRSPERRMPKKSRRKTTMKRAKHYKYIYYEQGLSRDFFLIIGLCLAMALALICSIRPFALHWLISKFLWV